jgi:hypothetical protein
MYAQMVTDDEHNEQDKCGKGLSDEQSDSSEEDEDIDEEEDEYDPNEDNEEVDEESGEVEQDIQDDDEVVDTSYVS